MGFETILDESRSRDYIEHGLWINRTIIDVFDEHVKNVPDKTLLIAAGGIRWTYKEVAKKVEILAANLACLGVGHGDVVSAQLPNWGEFLLIHLAVTKLGAVTNALLPIYREKDITHILGLAKTKLAIIIYQNIAVTMFCFNTCNQSIYIIKFRNISLLDDN